MTRWAWLAVVLLLPPPWAAAQGDSAATIAALERERDSLRAQLDTLRRTETCALHLIVTLPCPVFYVGTGLGYNPDGEMRLGIPQAGVGIVLYRFGSKSYRK